MPVSFVNVVVRRSILRHARLWFAAALTHGFPERLEVVSQPRITLEGKAQADSKAQPIQLIGEHLQ
jgi:hypothetical protein